MDPLSGPIAALAQVAPGLSATDSIAAAPPDSLAAARFAALMAQPPVPAGAMPALDAPAVAAAPGLEPAAPASVGDRILSGMHGVAGDMQTAWGNISGMLRAGEHQVGIQDMLRLQMNLMQVTMQYELVGKAVSRTGQNIDHLVRLQ